MCWAVGDRPRSIVVAFARRKNMSSELLTLAPIGCVVLALVALYYFTRI
jgi:hypothetical protein